MLVLRSIPMSLAILWRMMLVMPFVLIGLLVFTAMLAIWLLTAALFFPSLFILAGTFLFYFPQVAFLLVFAATLATTSVVPLMIGSRLGLQAKGIIVKESPAKLILPSLGYGLFEGLFALIVFSLAIGLFFLLTPLSLSEIAAWSATDAQQKLPFLILSNVGMGLAIIVGASCLLLALRAALLVPLAGASVNRDYNNAIHTPFMGFGSRFLSLFFVTILAYLVSALTLPAVGAVAYLIGGQDTVLALAALQSAPPELGQVDMPAPDIPVWHYFVLLLTMFAFSLWFFSLQCAAGVLAYLDKKNDNDAETEEETQHQRMSQEELRALWKSRMPPGNK